MYAQNLEDLSDDELLARYKDTKNLQYRNKLVERYSYIAEILAKKFLRGNAEYDDLYQVAALALIKAIDRFDAGYGNKLSTFLTPSIVGELKNYYRDKTQPMRMSREGNRVHALVTNAAAELAMKTGKKPTADEIARQLNLPVEKVLTGLEYEVTLVSLDSKVSDSETALAELIPDTADAYQEVENRDFFESCLKLLTEPEQKLIALRFIKEYSQAETARELGVSQMFVSRLERKIIEKLKTTFRNP